MACADVEVLVVGAGAAGIAAARRLRALGRGVVVLEAAGHVGGRCFTESATLGAPFNHGAEWLHAADDNPLTPLARDLGMALREEAGREERVLVGDRPATDAELEAYEAAWDAFDPAIERAVRRLAPGEDATVADAAPRGGPWDATVAHWQGEVICGATLDAIGLRDFWEVGLEGRNLLPEPGMGALLARLAEGLPVRLGAAVRALRWGGQGCAAAGDFGAVRARAAIITVSTGVLAAGGLRFDPPLPADVAAAVDGLPLGHVEKVGLRLRPGRTLGLAPFTRLERRAEGADDTPVVWTARPFGRPILVGWLGGRLALRAAEAGPAAAEAIARAELARHVGAAAVERDVAPGASVTGWTRDPLFRGAYSNARPGHAGARAALRDAAPAGGRLRFAGEACHARYAATAGGAWASGEHAADAVHAAL